MTYIDEEGRIEPSDQDYIELFLIDDPRDSLGGMLDYECD